MLTGNGDRRDDSSWAIGRLLDGFHVDIGSRRWLMKHQVTKRQLLVQKHIKVPYWAQSLTVKGSMLGNARASENSRLKS